MYPPLRFIFEPESMKIEPAPPVAWTKVAALAVTAQPVRSTLPTMSAAAPPLAVTVLAMVRGPPAATLTRPPSESAARPFAVTGDRTSMAPVAPRLTTPPLTVPPPAVSGPVTERRVCADASIDPPKSALVPRFATLMPPASRTVLPVALTRLRRRGLGPRAELPC